MIVRVLPEAAKDIADAAVWYDSVREGLGLEFKDEVLTTLRRIGEGPARYRVVLGNYRKAIVRRYPYVVYFRESGEAILI
jgi:plasmid stabilization system protein ParE